MANSAHHAYFLQLMRTCIDDDRSKRINERSWLDTYHDGRRARTQTLDEKTPPAACAGCVIATRTPRGAVVGVSSAFVGLEGGYVDTS